MTIIISVMYMLDLDIPFFDNILIKYAPIENPPNFSTPVLCVFSFSLFVINVFFIWLILIFSL